MKKFLAVYFGTKASLDKWMQLDESVRKEREQKGVMEWKNWVSAHQSSIAEIGAPLGKTKRVDSKGISDMKNELTAFTVVTAESHDAAAKLFLEHPHFTTFPGDHIEIMECLAIPGM